MKNNVKAIATTSLLAALLAFGATACSPGPSKAEEAASAAASQSAVALQSVDARSVVESFLAEVKADSISSTKSATPDFRSTYGDSLKEVSSSTVKDNEAQKLVSSIVSIFKSSPTATISVDDSKVKVEGGKSVVSLADLAIYDESGKPVANPLKSGSITVSKVDGKDMITGVVPAA